MNGTKTSVALFLLGAIVVIAVVAGVWGKPNQAGALPSAGRDLLNVSAEANVASRLGEETIVLGGTIELVRGDPRMDGSVEVVDIEIVAINLTGESVTGPVGVSQSGLIGTTGELRSLQPPPDQFPASLAFNAFIDVSVPTSGGSPPTVHNEEPLELAAVEPVDSWPPLGAVLEAVPEAPEASHCAGDGPGGLPLLPLLPAELCVTSVTMTMGVPKTPPPTLTACPADVCPPTLTPTATRTTVATSTPRPPVTFTPTLSPTPPRPPDCVPAVRTGDTYTHSIPVPLGIPDNTPGGTGDCILISEPAVIDDLNVVVRVSHEWIGDVAIELFHEESGTRVMLIDRPGQPPGFGCAAEDLDVILDDEADEAAEDQCDFNPPAISGRLRPNQPLSEFDGDSLLGSWFITVSDNAGAGVGTLDAWSIIVERAGLPGDANCDEGVDSIDAALVLQVSAALLSAAPCPDEADVDRDGNTNALDAVLILQFAAGLIDRLPA